MTLRVMVVATRPWSLSAHLSISFAKHGALVALVAPSNSVVRRLKVVGSRFDYRPWAGPRSIARAIRTWKPDLVVPGDDGAVNDMHSLYEREQAASRKQSSLSQLIATSLGDPKNFPIAQLKSLFMGVAQSNGVRCPKTMIIASETALDRALINARYPVVLKADGSYGGNGVRIVSNPEEARQAFRSLLKPSTFLGAASKSLDGLIMQPAIQRITRKRRTVTLQEYVAGRCANRAVVCRNGSVLAGLSVEVLETVCANGPASIVRVIEHPEMSATAQAMAKALKLEGFCGFDFIIDTAGRAWLLEMNPRVTPISHLSLSNGDDLVGALLSAITGQRCQTLPPPLAQTTIALFPQELRRRPDSEYFASSFHDVPLDEPAFVKACMEMQSRQTIAARFRRQLGLCPRKVGDAGISAR